MRKDERNYMYVYDENRHKVIIIDGETGEKIEKRDDRVTAILKHLKNRHEDAKLRKFAVWCAYQINKEIKPIQNKLIQLAEQAIQGKAGIRELRNLYEETEGAAIATDTVGLRQGSEQAPAFLATRECINPQAFYGALQAARFHRLWAEMHNQHDRGDQFLREIEVQAATDAIEEVEQQQIDYLLELINKK